MAQPAIAAAMGVSLSTVNPRTWPMTTAGSPGAEAEPSGGRRARSMAVTEGRPCWRAWPTPPGAGRCLTADLKAADEAGHWAPNAATATNYSLLPAWLAQTDAASVSSPTQHRAQNTFKKRLFKCWRKARRVPPAGPSPADHVADEARFCRIAGHGLCSGPGRYPTRSGLTAHSRIHLFVRCSLAEGRDVRLPDHADVEWRASRHSSPCCSRFARQDILWFSMALPTIVGDTAVPDNISLLFLPPYSPSSSEGKSLG